MYFYPGQPRSPYRPRFPKKKRGRPTDAQKVDDRNLDLFSAELLLFKPLQTGFRPLPEALKAKIGRRGVPGPLGPGVAAQRPPATNRGGKSGQGLPLENQLHLYYEFISRGCRE